MFGRMIDSPEEAEAVSDFVGSLRIKSSEDSITQGVMKQHGDDEITESQRMDVNLEPDQEGAVGSPVGPLADTVGTSKVSNEKVEGLQITLPVPDHEMEILQRFDFKIKWREIFPTVNITFNNNQIEVPTDYIEECQEMLVDFMSGMSSCEQFIAENTAKFLTQDVVRNYVNNELNEWGLQCVWYADGTTLHVYSKSLSASTGSCVMILGCVKEYTLGPVTSTSWKYSNEFDSLKKTHQGKFSLLEDGRMVILVATHDIADVVKTQITKMIT